MTPTNNQLVEQLRNAKVAVIPTDTVYGIVASALQPNAVEGVYKIRGRNPAKPCIILISQINDLARFGIDPQPYMTTLHSYWPGPVSIVLACKDPGLAYLHRGTNSLAFRLPSDEWLRDLLQRTGPLIAPSANSEGSPTATTIDEAKHQFGGKVAYYLDHGELRNKPSMVISLLSSKEEIIRNV